MLLLAAFLGCLCVVQTSAQDPDDLLAIEQLADKNYISRYNSWEYPYYLLPSSRFGRQINPEEEESKSLPVMEMPLTLSNPIVSIINRANRFYRMIRNPDVRSRSPSKQYLVA